MANNLCIDLNPRKDSAGRTYYIGKLKAPMMIDCRDGIALICFVSEAGSEQIQISSMEKKDE
jgi:hypothetical protein